MIKSTVNIEATGPLKLTHVLECDGTGGGGTLPPPPPPAGVGELLKNKPILDRLFPDASEWYIDVRDRPVHPLSTDIIMSYDPVVSSLPRRTQNDWGPDLGMSYSVGKNWPPVPMRILYAAESEAGPHPIPLDAPIELGPDKHLLYVDEVTRKIYELGMAAREGEGFYCEACAVWDRNGLDDQRPSGNTSADAAGTCILAGLVRFDEFDRAMATSEPCLDHALRFTLPRTGQGFIYPARHYTSNHGPYALPTHPPMGMRCRVNPNLDLSEFNPASQCLLRTLQRHGGILCDNGAPWFFSGTEDPQWSKYFAAITGTTDDGISFKTGFAGALFESNMQILAWDDGEVTTQV